MTVALSSLDLGINDWRQISDLDDREVLGVPDARMSSIWGYRTEYHDHDNNPATGLVPRRTISVEACATE